MNHSSHGDSRFYSKTFFFLGAWLFLACVDLTWISWNPPYFLRDQVELYLVHIGLPAFVGGVLVMYLPYFLAIVLVRKGIGTLRTVLLFSVAYRLALIPGFPILETDLYRYLWDGRMMGIGVNPYEYSPGRISAALQDEEGESGVDEDLSYIVAVIRKDPLYREILSHINNKSVPTIYMPTAQAVFAGSDFLVRHFLCSDEDNDGSADWYQKARLAVVVWKSFLLTFDLGVLALIVLLLRRLSLDGRWVLVYGWSPLVLKEYANTGHFDPIVLFFTLLGVFFLLDNLSAAVEGCEACRDNDFAPADPPSRFERTKQFSAGISFALAAACKLYPVVYLPLLARLLGPAGFIGFALGGVVLYLPFIGIGTGFLAGLATYSERWENNSSVVSLLEWGISRLQDLFRTGAEPTGAHAGTEPSPLFHFGGVAFYFDAFFMAKLIAASILLLVVATAAWRVGKGRGGGGDPLSLLRGCFHVTGAILILSPTVFPWYVGWIVPFLCFFPNPAWITFTGLVQVYYLRFWNRPVDYIRFSDIPFLGVDSEWELVRPVEYLLFYSFLLAWYRLARRNRRHPGEAGRSPEGGEPVDVG